MKLGMIALAAALGLATAAAPAAAQAAKPAAATAPAKPMNYDCTKAGNKNKAACKNVAVAAPAKPAPMAASATTTSRATAAKDTSSSGVAATLKNGKVVHYDCSKPGNKDKKACGAK